MNSNLARRMTAIVTGMICTTPLSADILVMTDGGRIEGTVTSRDAKADYLVELTGKTLIAIPRGNVAQHIKDPPKLAEYRKLSSELKDTANEHLEFSKWCRQNGLTDQAERHLSRVVELEPNLGPARAALKQTLVNGVWVPKDQLERMRGKVLSEGKWQIPEAKAIADQAEEVKSRVLSWQVKVKRMRADAISGRRGGRAMAELQGITDPLASVAIKDWVADLIKQNNPPTNEFSLCLELLSQWNTPATINALSWMAICNDPVVRERAITLLQDKNPQLAAGYFTTELRSSDNVNVRRAAVALAQMRVGDPTLALIDALVTKHKFQENAGSGNVNSAFSSDGSSGGMGFGNKAKTIIKPLQNPEVLSALVSLNSGVNYQYDQDAWRLWYAQRADYPYDLRRDP